MMPAGGGLRSVCDRYFSPGHNDITEHPDYTEMTASFFPRAGVNAVDENFNAFCRSKGGHCRIRLS